MHVHHLSWKKWVGTALTMSILSVSILNLLFLPAPACIETKKSRFSLNTYLNLSLLVDAVLYNYNGGRFTETSIPTTRAFHDGFGILSIIQERYNIDQDYTIAETEPVQGSNGGIYLELMSLNEYSYPAYYVLNAYHNLGKSFDGIINQNKYGNFVVQCYNVSQGGFALKPGDPSNVLANWMIVQTLSWFNLTAEFNLTKNLDFCVKAFQITDAQNVFSCVATTHIIGVNSTLFFNRTAIISQCEGIFLSSFDYFDRFFGLMTLELLEVSPTHYNTSSYLHECIAEFNAEVNGVKNLHNLYAKLCIIALLLGEITTMGFII